MHREREKKRDSRRGSALVVTVVMLGFAGFIVTSLLTMSTSFAWNCEKAYRHDKAFFLADAGLRAALAKLNALSDANISYSESRDYFGDTRSFAESDWGFNTRISSSNSRYFVLSTGRYSGNTVDVQAEVTLGAGQRSIHALYAHALFAGSSLGQSNYVLKVGGTGTGADFVKGDVYSGNAIELSGDAQLRLPEIMVDTNGDRLCTGDEEWTNAYAIQTFTNPLTKVQFDAYKASMAPYMSKVYNNGKYDFGEAFVDTIGNGVYDVGEPFEDLNGNGDWDEGDTYIDRNSNGVYNAGVDTVVDYGNGQWDAGEEWEEDASHTQRQNGKYDPAGGYWLYSSRRWNWKTSYTVNRKTYYCAAWPAEQFEDQGDGVYDSDGEPYTDQNGIYDAGEEYLDDRNELYDYGTAAKGATSGMPAPGPGQKAVAGYDTAIDPPNLTNMCYSVDRNAAKPAGALERWGNDVVVTASDYGTAKAITDSSRPEHIFVRNPPTSGSTTSGGKTISGRTYTYTYATNGARIDDYFLEDPAYSGYNSSTAPSIDGSTETRSMYINVTAAGNDLLYYVDGNLFIHNPNVYSMRFLRPGTHITIVANGNITISDEFYYNASYPAGLTPDDMNSTVVQSPSDALCLIALKNQNAPTNSGNIYIGDAQFGTGGSIHALLYAENNFVDNNLNTASQPYISIFGNMTAGNQVRINRSGSYRTRLDVTLDERIRSGTVIVPGLPHPLGSQRSIMVDTAWHMVPGTWTCFTALQ